MFRIMKSFVLSLLIFLDANNSSFAQTTSLSAAAWEKKLSDPGIAVQQHGKLHVRHAICPH